MTEAFETDIFLSLEVLRAGGIILCPTETFWAICCDASSESAVEKIFRVTQALDAKAVTVLMAEEREVLQCVANPDLSVFDFLEEQNMPTTVVFETALGLPDSILTEDGSVAIRIVQDQLCRHLIKRLRSPLVSVPAKLIGDNVPLNYVQVAEQISAQADYVVRWRQNKHSAAQPFQIIRWKNGAAEHI